jgi:uncharacterized protein (TIGR02145 family)
MEIIKFGEQNWANDNCKLKSFANGEQIIQANTAEEWIANNKKKIPSFAFYDFNAENENKYGLIYNWHVVVNKNILVEGFRVPNNDDWKIFKKNLVGYDKSEIDLDKYWELVTSAGKDLKSKSLWNHYGVSSNGLDKYKFNITPGGGVNAEGAFSHLGVTCSLWSNTIEDKFRWNFSIDDRYNMQLIGIQKKSWGHGNYLRLIKQ